MSEKLNRRKFIELAGAAGAGVVGGYLWGRDSGSGDAKIKPGLTPEATTEYLPAQPTATQTSTPTESAQPNTATPEPTAVQIAEARRMPEWLKDNTIEFGFNTHPLSVQDGKQEVEILATMGQKWNRFPVREDEVTNISGPDMVNWNRSGLEKNDQLIRLNQEAGLRVMIPTALPGFNRSFTHGERVRFARNYFGGLADRWNGQVAVWQIFNEPNVHDYIDYHDFGNQPMNDEYLAQFAEVVKAAREGIFAADPSALVTVNMSYWFGRPKRNNLDDARRLFAAVANDIDVLTVDFYPDDESDVGKIPEIIETLQRETGKKVIIGELGLSTDTSGLDQQINLMTKAIDVLKSAKILPKAILFYELRDQGVRGHEQTFGILDTQFNPKPSFVPIANDMRLENGNTSDNNPVTPVG